ncbi:hypothetical protein KSP39_PZI016829 [Platanthera zijinensis]|uniref:Calcineurin-like phosphoesterase domain-containing protein n=1 Tax=Platanthera zijinensis TaxID=2320716 RepID=A0AAP0B6B3_9ASPA
MQSLSRLTLVLCCAWVLTILYGELIAYWVPLWTCSWPQLEEDLSSSSSIDRTEVKVAIVADPQLMDRTSLSLAPKSLALETAKFYTDLYMRRSFRSSILPFKPNLVIFLGDHFDGGPYLADQEWKESYNRFKHIFGLEAHGRYSDIQVYYLSGNHDIGYSNFHTQHPELPEPGWTLSMPLSSWEIPTIISHNSQPEYEPSFPQSSPLATQGLPEPVAKMQVIQRYEKEFGARNYRFSAGKLDFIVVDAQTLDGPKQGKETFLSWQFIKNISQADTVTPRVLLTHIPLYRPNDSLCGPHRSSSIINQRVSYAPPDQGIKYQNYLTKDTSDSLLHFIKPTLVLSGHDHDQCMVTHSTDFGSIVEHTLGTISWQQGNLYPSFMLLTARDSNTTGSTNPVSTNLCFLPMQTHIYIWYLFQFAFTLLLFFVWPTNGFTSFGRFAGFVSSVKSKWATMKEKTDEEDCEYDTIWDSEGSMHLIRKNKPRPVASLDVGVTGRGNAVLRSSAKKQTTHEQDASILVLETNIDMNVDKSEKMRQSRSKITRLVLRLIRVLRMVIIIAAVNVPLYMMLLFKDWIDR